MKLCAFVISAIILAVNASSNVESMRGSKQIFLPSQSQAILITDSTSMSLCVLTATFETKFDACAPLLASWPEI